jgi:hypothetical protein
MTDTKCNRLAVLVTGSRGWTDLVALESRLDKYRTVVDYGPRKVVPRGSVLLHGNAVGADAMAARCTYANWIIEATPYFDWLGKSGGHVRNAFMLDKLKLYQRYSYLCSVEAFSLGTPGTEGMIKIAEKAGFDVHVTRGDAP